MTISVASAPGELFKLRAKRRRVRRQETVGPEFRTSVGTDGIVTADGIERFVSTKSHKLAVMDQGRREPITLRCRRRTLRIPLRPFSDPQVGSESRLQVPCM